MNRGHKNAFCDLSAAYVRKIFSYNSRTGTLIWRRRLSKRIHIGDIAGTAKDKGRISIGINGKEYKAHRIAWLFVTGKWPKYEIDHRDENQSNNRWNNLRHATPSQNHRNRGCQRNNTTGYKGVTRIAKNKYIAGVKHKGKRYNCGTFKTALAAYKAAKILAIKLHGAKWAKYN